MELSFERVQRQTSRFQATRRKGLASVLDAQREQLERLVHHARTSSPFYEQLYRTVPRASFHLRDLPITNKPMILEHYDDVVTDRRLNLKEVKAFTEDAATIGTLYKDEFVIANTSGTTGLRGYVAQHALEWETYFALNALKPCRLPPGPGVADRLLGAAASGLRIAVVASSGSNSITPLAFRIMPDLLKRLCQFERISTLLPVDEMVERLNRFRPDRIHGYATLVEALAHKQLEGLLRIHPVGISTYAEPLTSRARTTIDKAWGVFVQNVYGSTEGWTMTKECPHGRMHICLEGCLLEPIERNGDPTAPGEKSDRILVTNLHNFTQPVLRYELQDSVIPLAGPCACGSILPSVHVIGREDDTLYCQAADGAYVPLLPVPLEILMWELTGYTMFQIRQVERNRIRVIFVPSRGTNPEEGRNRVYSQFSGYFARHGLEHVIRLEVEPRQEVERSATSGKVMQIASLVGPPPDLEGRLTYR